jgi:hypothetical protein
MQFHRRREMAHISRQQRFLFPEIPNIYQAKFFIENGGPLQKWISITAIHQTETYFAHNVLYTK